LDHSRDTHGELTLGAKTGGNPGDAEADPDDAEAVPADYEEDNPGVTAKQNASTKKRKSRAESVLGRAEFDQLKQGGGYIPGFNPLTGRFSDGIQYGSLSGLPVYHVYTGDDKGLAKIFIVRMKEDDVESQQNLYFIPSFPMERLDHALNFVRNYKENRGNSGKSAKDFHSASDKVFSMKVRSNVKVNIEMQDGWIWCFTNCSQTVRQYVKTIGKSKDLKLRVAQLMGWEDVLSPLIMSPENNVNTFIDVYCWQKTIFSQAWSGLGAKLDPDTRVKLGDKLYWRSYTANTQLHVNKLLAMTTYLMERIAYRNMASNTVKARIKTLISAIINAVNKAPLAERIDEFRAEIQAVRFKLHKSAKDEGFCPFRYFLGSDGAPGTGKLIVFASRATT
jgi:hypothetical protein